MEVTKSVTVAELAEHLQDYIAEVEDGVTIYVVEGGKEIAIINPASEPLDLVEPPVGRRPCDFEPAPLSKPLLTDPAEMIIEERERERSGAKYK